MTAQNKIQKGFTLIELLVVIGILAVLLAITLIAINPARQFGNANDTARRSHVTQILNAIGQYSAENKGTLPAGLTTPLTAAEFDSTHVVGLCAALVNKYIPALPTDPSLNKTDITDCAAAFDTGYTVAVDANGRITVAAPSAYAGATAISVTR
jgi:prepilin-type N-terminal cleavage/methylation domain-containing protein